ncbi:MAG: hypothetical protein QW039_01165 [Fervidicoccaceae archaeon]
MTAITIGVTDSTEPISDNPGLRSNKFNVLNLVIDIKKLRNTPEIDGGIGTVHRRINRTAII